MYCVPGLPEVVLRGAGPAGAGLLLGGGGTLLTHAEGARRGAAQETRQGLRLRRGRRGQRRAHDTAGRYR